MSHSKHASSLSQALYKVFVLPTLTRTTPHLRRTFTSTPPSHAKTRIAETRSQKWNEEISAPIIQLVDPETDKLSEPVTRYDVLRTFDPKTHRLVQLTPDPSPYLYPFSRDFIPACKIISKKSAYESAQKAKTLAKAKKRVQKVVSGQGLKTVELNWAIDRNDLGHRIQRIREFLGEGRRVEVVLAAKKRGRKASREECEVVLESIRGAVGEVEGAKVREGMTGKVGAFVTMVFQGRPPPVIAAKAGADVEEEEEDEEEEEEEDTEKKTRKRWDRKDKETMSTLGEEKAGGVDVK